MVSDAELVERLRDFLRSSDLNTTTTAIVRRKLEEDFGVDLTKKKVFIREQVDLFLQSQLEKTEEEEEEEDDGDEDEEEGGGEGEGEGEGEEDGSKSKKIKSGAKNGSEDEEDDEESEEEEEEEEETSKGRRGRKKGVSNKKDVKRKGGGGGGFAKVCSLSPQLQSFVGVSKMARTEVVRSLWAYIREKDLQDPKNRRNIICDETLRNLFSVDVINMFQMNKALSKHIWPLDSEEAPVKTTQKEKQRKSVKREDSDEPKPKRKRREGAASGFLAPLKISDALVNFFGTGETTLTRAEVIKKMWVYIKQHDLQDPSDKRRVKCDDKLKELFDVDSFVGFTVPKLLAVHFIKPEK